MGLKTLLFPSGLFLLLLIGCSSGDSPIEAETLTVDQRDELPSVHFSNLISEDLEIVPLENFDREGNPIYFRSINRLAYFNREFFILDYLSNQNILVFEIDGKYNRSIGFRGDGPGGYKQPMDFHLSEEEIEVLDFGKVLSYDLEGNYIDSRKTSIFMAHGFEKLVNGYAFIGAGRDTDNLILTNDQLEFENSFFPYHTRALNLMMINPLYKNFQGKTIYRRHLNDTIFHVVNFEKPKPYIYIDFKQKKSNINELLASENIEQAVLLAEKKHCIIMSFYETENYKFLIFSLEGERWNYIHSESTKESKLFRQSNLIDEVTFDPNAMPIGVIGNKFVFKARPDRVLAGIESYQFPTPHFQKLEALESYMDPEGNPVLFLVEFDF